MITSNVQNTYNLNETDFYVASSSMPAMILQKQLIKALFLKQMEQDCKDLVI